MKKNAQTIVHTTVGSLLPHNGEPLKKRKKIRYFTTNGDPVDAWLTGRTKSSKNAVIEVDGKKNTIPWDTPAERRL